MTWNPFHSERGGPALSRVAIVIGTLVVALVVARLLARDPTLGLFLAGLVLFIGVISADVVAIPVLVMPFLLVTARIGGGGFDLTLSDALLALACIPAILVASAGVSHAMRRTLWLWLVYQVVTLFAVVNNPYRANVVEWVHSGVLVGGSLLVGWAVGRRGRGRWGLGLLVAAGLVLAGLTLVVAVGHYGSGEIAPVEPQWPYAMQKNALGTILAFVGIVVYARPAWLGWRRGPSLSAFWVIVAAIFATQSRQSLIGLAAAILVLVLRRSTTRRRSKAILLVMLPALLVVSSMVQSQVESGNQFNSFFQRVTWFQDSIRVWATDPWFGAGLRWWYTDRFGVAFQPPNAEIDTLTSSGVVGLAAFVALIVGTWLIARRLGPNFGLIAELVLITRFVQSQFDLYWVSVQVSLPFIILGICLGAAAHHEATLEASTRRPREIDRARAPAEASS